MRIGAVLVAGALLAACAAEVTRVPATLRPDVPADARPVVAEADATVLLDSHFERTIRKGSRWVQVGDLPQGRVFRALGDPFTVEGAHVHEAFLVIGPDGRLAGFYLPVERAFAPLSTQPIVRMTIDREEKR